MLGASKKFDFAWLLTTLFTRNKSVNEVHWYGGIKKRMPARIEGGRSPVSRSVLASTS
jgi:hypothetical protein